MFYISGREGKVAAMAKAQRVEIGSPEDMYAKYGPLGVLNKEEVYSAAGESDKVQAIRFDYLEPLPKPIRLPRLRLIIPNLNLQTTSAIPFEIFLKLRQEANLPNAGTSCSNVGEA